MSHRGREPFAPRTRRDRDDYWTTGPQPGLSVPDQVKNDVERLKTAYAELGQWGRHYSAIRATMSIGLVAATSVLLNESFRQNSHTLAVLSLVIVSFMFVLLLIFTEFTYVMMRRQNSVGAMLLLPRQHRHRVPCCRWLDPGVLAALAITVTYATIVVLYLTGNMAPPRHG